MEFRDCGLVGDAPMALGGLCGFITGGLGLWWLDLSSSSVTS